MKTMIWSVIACLGVMPVMAHSACNSSIVETTPTARFIDNEDGTVTDARTALMWARCALGQTWNGTTCTGTATKHTWQGALQLAETSDYAGHMDWRLPNVKELVSIVERRCSDPSINSTIFPATPTFYFWTNSAAAQGAGTQAHNVSFSDGTDLVDYKQQNPANTFFDHHVRLVRDAR